MAEAILSTRLTEWLNGARDAFLSGGSPLGTFADQVLLGDRLNDLALLALDVDAAEAAIAAYDDQFINVALAATGGSGGATAGTLETTATRAKDAAALASARQFLIVATAAQYSPVVAVVATVTFSAATKGSIAATGNGWALVTTNATGEFDCTVSDSADETVYLRAITPQAGDAVAERAVVVFSESDAATWAP